MHSFVLNIVISPPSSLLSVRVSLQFLLVTSLCVIDCSGREWDVAVAMLTLGKICTADVTKEIQSSFAGAAVFCTDGFVRVRARVRACACVCVCAHTILTFAFHVGALLWNGFVKLKRGRMYNTRTIMRRIKGKSLCTALFDREHFRVHKSVPLSPGGIMGPPDPCVKWSHKWSFSLK